MSSTGKTIALIKAMGLDPTLVEGAVEDWLDDHPEATTTVQDGAISRAKLDADLKAKTDAVPDLKSATNHINELTISTKYYKNKYVADGIKTGYIYKSGTVNTELNARYTEYYIDVSNDVGKYLTLSYESGNLRCLSANILSYVFYDENKVVLSSISADSQNVSKVLIPSDAYYVRLTLYRSVPDLTNVMLSFQTGGTTGISDRGDYSKGYLPNEHVNTGYYDLETFVGDTAWDKLKSALSVVDRGVISCSSEIVIDSSPFEFFPFKDYRRITITGATIALGGHTMFNKSFTDEYCYVPKFNACHFVGTGTIFGISATANKQGIIGVVFNCCYLNAVTIMNNSAVYMQSVRMNVCEVVGSATLINASKLWDSIFTDNRFEAGTGTLIGFAKSTTDGSVSYDCYHLVLKGNVIEGRANAMFAFNGRATDIHIVDNYFEGNYAPYFAITEECERLQIADNYFNEWDSSYTHLITISKAPTSEDLTGNVLVQPTSTDIDIFG